MFCAGFFRLTPRIEVYYSAPLKGVCYFPLLPWKNHGALSCRISDGMFRMMTTERSDVRMNRRRICQSKTSKSLSAPITPYLKSNSPLICLESSLRLERISKFNSNFWRNHARAFKFLRSDIITRSAPGYCTWTKRGERVCVE